MDSKPGAGYSPGPLPGISSTQMDRPNTATDQLDGTAHHWTDPQDPHGGGGGLTVGSKTRGSLVWHRHARKVQSVLNLRYRNYLGKVFKKVLKIFCCMT